MEEDKNNNSSKQVYDRLFKKIGPTKTFLFGIMIAVLVSGTIGFIIVVTSGNTFSDSNDSNSSTSDSATAVNTNPAAIQQTTNVTAEPISSDDHVKGDINTASVVIIEYSDTECPFCKRFHPTMQQLVSANEGKVAWVYRHFPLDSLHSKARKEAEATECAAELGGNDGFWAYLDRLFEITPSNDGLEASQLSEIAIDVGLDAAKFQSCLDSGKYADKVESQYQDAVSAGGNGTPYSLVVNKNGEIIPVSGAQPINSVQAIIDAML